MAHGAASQGAPRGARTDAWRLMTDTAEVVDVAVIGLGYIGLPTAAVLARAGLGVVGVDRVRERVEAVNRGELPFLEEGLATVLAEQVEAGRLRAQTMTPSARTGPTSSRCRPRRRVGTTWPICLWWKPPPGRSPHV